MNLSPALEDAAVAELRGRPGPKPKKVTPDRFNEAVKTLKDRGEKIAVEAVRLLIGGNPGTVGTMVREYKESLRRDTSTVSFPESLANALRSYAAESVAEVSEEWKHRYDEVRAICVSLETSSNEAEDERDRLENEVEQLLNQRQRDEGRNGRLREEVDSKNVEIAALRTQLMDERLHASRVDAERAAVFDRLIHHEDKYGKKSEQLELLREEVAVLNVAVVRTQAKLEYEQLRNLENKERRKNGIEQRTFSDEGEDDSPLSSI